MCVYQSYTVEFTNMLLYAHSCFFAHAHTHTHTEGDISSAGVLLEKKANGKYYLVAPHIEDPDEQGVCVCTLYGIILTDTVYTAHTID